MNFTYLPNEFPPKKYFGISWKSISRVLTRIHNILFLLKTECTTRCKVWILCLHLNNFQSFSEYQLVDLIWYKYLLLHSHFLEPFLKSNLNHWRSDHSHFKSHISHYKSYLAHWKMITATLKAISATTKVILATEEVITATLKVISAITKAMLATSNWCQPL